MAKGSGSGGAVNSPGLAANGRQRLSFSAALVDLPCASRAQQLA